MAAGYTFLPWCRRGIVAELNTADTGQALDQRAAVRVGATITNAGPGGVDITVLGPGDVTGLDLRLVVRTQPRPGTDTFEPNHLAAVDFDLPDLPWLVTPARAGSGDGLRPWIALVVVEQQLGVSLGLEAGALLPVLRIESPADARVELPDPGSTDLWAHGQLLADAAIAPSAVPAELEAHPGRNVSRLVCPRRLRAGARYYACVVPAFDAGAVRGLGGMPVEGAPLAPSWGGAAVRLPVYFHWEFSTGPEGDFETLAARLRPHQVSARLGRAPMHVGAAHPGVAELPEGDPAAVIDMDGALRAPSGDDLRLAEVDPRIRSGLRAAANAAARQVSGRNAPLIVGPPVHGSWAVNRHELTDDGPAWLTELNVDPRARVAAGLGADAVRRNQEDLMHAAWVQLADVRAANDRLNAARLSLEVARKAYARHLVPLPADRLVPLASPVHRRTLLGQVTLPEAVRPTSLPDAAMGPALRRLTSARRPLLRAAARHTGRTFTPAVVAMLAPGFEGVDPTRFVPDGIVSMASLEALAVPADPDAAVGLDGLGVAGGTIRAARLHAQRDRARRLAPMAGQEVDVRVRRGAGLVAAGHLAAIEDLPGLGGDERAALARQLVATAGAAEGSEAFLLAVDETDRPTVGALDLAPDGTVTLRARRGRPVVVGRIDVALSNRPGGLPGVLRRLPPGTIDRTGASRFRVRPNPGGGVIVDSAVLNPTLVPRRVPTAVVPPLVADAATRSRFRGAFDPFAGRFRLDAAPERPVAVAFDLTAAAAAVLRRTDPDRTVPARVAEMVRIGGHDIRQPPPGVSVAPTLDRVMAGPSFDVPTYLYLARHDRHRFCPGIDEVPVDSVTLLETNPRFVEAYLVGLNHEMNHELVWRTYPTDQRGTPFTRFWDRLDGRPDVGPIHQFGPGRLGAHLVDAEPQLVLLVRGELLRRYPTAAVYAVRSTAGGEMSTRDEDTLTPIFAGSFEPDIAFVGFDLQEDDLDDGNGWFFVIQEQPTEPRFGLDDPAARPGAEPATWSEAAWSDTGLAPGQHLTPAALAAVGLGALPHAGATAAALFQRPVRVAVHARRLVAPEA